MEKHPLVVEIESIDQELNALQLGSAEQAEQFRLKYLSKKGRISLLFDTFRAVEPQYRKDIGKSLNVLKSKAEAAWKAASSTTNHSAKQAQQTDYSAPGWPFSLGSRHPLSIVANEIQEIFNRIGFSVAEGPEIEDDWHNFSALNFPKDHPARDMQDTFFISTEPEMALRTHTSSVQIRMMEAGQPPFRMIMPGRVYRNEAVSARAHCFFHQVEALYIDQGVSFADLKQTLLYLARELFGKDTQIRLRPSYFPFTEPSAEMDISCSVCKGDGCNICKYSGWVEILGCGMVHPNVLRNCNIDPEKYTGFALGMGIERIAILKYQVKDLRLFSQNDLRFLKQFNTGW
ncbi:MAG: phenylalanine--tRNA ligase subunit alpha [Bacteroidia bacterium]|jgi:phenylalanyl-tRNA synthetase alpha chain|nr:phenylalanine--tRNA ligase subunit alpha [Bacteroidia bacterium]MCC6769416.1 phenylalanine--tRNA ligase subunit alpha [Bacteroidia bacterium]